MIIWDQQFNVFIYILPIIIGHSNNQNHTIKWSDSTLSTTPQYFPILKIVMRHSYISDITGANFQINCNICKTKKKEYAIKKPTQFFF